MNIIQSDRLVKIRKTHRCIACMRKFDPPVKMWYQVNDYDGIATVYTCISCNELITNYRSELTDDWNHVFEEGCTHEMLLEYQRDNPELSTIEELLEFKKKQKPMR